MDLCAECLSPEAAWTVIALAVSLGAVAAFVLRARLPMLAVSVVLAVAGGLLGWGAIQLTSAPSATDAWVAVAGLAILVPFHVRIVLGPLGKRG